MRTIKITVVALLATASLTAQDLRPDQVPSTIAVRFQQDYPNASDVEWEMEGMDYKVEYEIDRLDYEIWYTAGGDVVKMERDLMEADLPVSVKAAINKKYNDYKVDSAEMTKRGDKVTYEVELEKGWLYEKKVIFDTNGKVLSEMDD